MVLKEVSKIVSVEADVYEDIEVASIGGAFYAIEDGVIAEPINADQIEAKIRAFAFSKFGIQFPMIPAEESSEVSPQ